MIKIKLKKEDVWFIRGCLRDASKNDKDKDVRKKANELFFYLVAIEELERRLKEAETKYKCGDK